MIYLQCKLIPKGIQSMRYMNIGEFETVSDANAAARGFAFGARGGVFGVKIHETSAAYYKGFSKGSKCHSWHFQLIYN